MNSEGTEEGFRELRSSGTGDRSEAVQSPMRIKVTDMRGDWDPGLLLMTATDRDNGNTVISPSRVKQVAKMLSVVLWLIRRFAYLGLPLDSYSQRL